MVEQLDEQTMNERLAAAHERIVALRSEISRAVVGQQRLIDRLLVALLVRGHVLLEGVPGLAKTLLAKVLASSVEGTFKRIQFTPDLLPADLTGTLIFDPARGIFTPRMGPIFANIVLADEINRAPAKVQSGLLEAMQERQVTIGDATWALPDPFMVIATQNPIEQEGTYVLPEAQVDRFLMKVLVDYPEREQEEKMLAMYLDPASMEIDIRKILSLDDLEALMAMVSRVHVDERIIRYIVAIVSATRDPREGRIVRLREKIEFGASPRASIALAHAAKGFAFLQGRGYVVPEDVKDVAPDVIRHRLIPTYEAVAERMTPDMMIREILGAVPVP
ncbi:MAG TPA: MoxR family ATPase [Thermoanaerobaculia bacterium]|nr:MoxR family ATPase [Thermoanaerobaculia bacterium]